MGGGHSTVCGSRGHGNAKSGARGGENRTQHGKFDCIPIPHHHADLPPIFWPSCREQTRPKKFMSVLFVVMCGLTSNGGTGGGSKKETCRTHLKRGKKHGTNSAKARHQHGPGATEGTGKVRRPASLHCIPLLNLRTTAVSRTTERG